MSTAIELVQRFREVRVLVIGDAMLDTYLEGSAARLCSEGPVPVIRKTEEHRFPGGAANTAANLRALNADVCFLGLFGSLALTVASLGIINTLVMAILERRREIGVLKALGASDGDVKNLFFAEAGAMGLVGGILGVTLGWLIGAALTLGTTLYLTSQDLPSVKISHVPWWLALTAIAFAIIVSLAAGLYPAARAARLNPVDALRYE